MRGSAMIATRKAVPSGAMAEWSASFGEALRLWLSHNCFSRPARRSLRWELR